MPTAPVGRLLAHLLVEDGVRVRVLVPDSEAAGWPSGVDMVQGSVLEPAAAESAFADVDRVFLAGLVSFAYERMRELTNLLLDGPLARVVVLSSHGSDFETAYSPETWQWLAFERALEVRGATWVHLRPAGLFAGATEGAYPITGSDWVRALSEGRPVREFLPEVAYPFLDEADCAAIAARLLLDDTAAADPLTGKLDVIGCLTSAHDQLDSINELLDARLRLEPLRSEDEARAHWRSHGWPHDTIAVTLYAMQAFRNASATTRDAVHSQIATAERLLGRPPRTFRDWLTDHLPVPPTDSSPHRAPNNPTSDRPLHYRDINPSQGKRA